MTALLGLAQLQQLLQSIHGVQAAPVREFLVDRAFRDRHAPRTSSHEALLLRENGEELHVGLFLDDSVLAQLARSATDPWTQERHRQCGGQVLHGRHHWRTQAVAHQACQRLMNATSSSGPSGRVR